MAASKSDVVETKLADGTSIYVEATRLGGETDVARAIPSFDGVTASVTRIATTLKDALREVECHRASMQFGLEIGLESGELTALLVKGTGTANLTITIEWGE